MSCAAETPDGNACQAKALKGGRYCFFHSPEKALEREAANYAGGKKRAKDKQREGPKSYIMPDAPDVELQTKSDVLKLLEETTSHLRRGELDPEIAHQLGYLANLALRTLMESEADQRLKNIEDQVRPLKGLSATQLLELVRSASHAPRSDG